MPDLLFSASFVLFTQLIINPGHLYSKFKEHLSLISNSTACQSLKHPVCFPHVSPTFNFLVSEAEMGSRSPKLTPQGLHHPSHQQWAVSSRYVTSGLRLLGSGAVFSNLSFSSLFCWHPADDHVTPGAIGAT